MRFTFDPTAFAALVLAGALYVRAVRVLRRRGRRVGRGQQASWWTGIVLIALALFSPLGARDDELLSFHMAQHLLLGDIAAPFLLAGLRWPVLLFVLPKPVLVPLARRKGLRRFFRVLRRPLVALPVYVVTVYVWHIGFAFEGALRHPVVHALQHESFLLANLLLWWPVIEPQKRRIGGDLWKIAYIFAARMSTMFLGMGFVFSRGILYAGFYGRGERAGLTPLQDQQTAGGLMMTLDIIMMAVAVCWFFWRASLDADREAPRQPAVSRP